MCLTAIFYKRQIKNVGYYKNFINFNNQDWTITLQIDLVNEVEESLDTLEDIYNLRQEN